MDRISGEELRKILEKAERRLGERINLEEMERFSGDKFSSDYEIFRKSN